MLIIGLGLAFMLWFLSTLSPSESPAHPTVATTHATRDVLLLALCAISAFAAHRAKQKHLEESE